MSRQWKSLKKRTANKHVKMNMFQVSSLEVVLRNTVEVVVVPLKDGVCSLNDVYQALIEADVDPVTGLCSNFNSIRQRIVEAHQHLQQCEQATSSELKRLNRNLEGLIEEKGRLQREMNETRQTLDNLTIGQASNEELLRIAHNKVTLAEKLLDSAEKTLQDQKNRKVNAAVVTGVGAGLLVIPVIGWIAGSAMVIGGAVEMDRANQAFNEAQDLVKESESELRQNEQKVSEYRSIISQTEGDISRKDQQLRQTREIIRQVKQQTETVGEVQSKLNTAVNLLALLSGKVRVVEHQTRTFILQEPVLKVMEDVMNMMMKITGNEFFYSEDMFTLIRQIKEKDRRLRVIEQQ